jgi:hypothetical protein
METQQIIALLLIVLFIWICKPKGEKKKVTRQPRSRYRVYKGGDIKKEVLTK